MEQSWRLAQPVIGIEPRRRQLPRREGIAVRSGDAVECRRLLGALLKEKGDLAGALAEYRACAAVKALPTEVRLGTMSAIGDLQRDRGELDAAIATLSPALAEVEALKPVPERLQVDVLTNLGLCLADPNFPDRQAEGLTLLRRAIAIDSSFYGDAHPLSFDSRSNLAATLLKLDDGSGAALGDAVKVLEESRRKVYDTIDKVGFGRSKVSILAALMKLRQVCCDPDMLPWLHAPLTDSGKLNLLVEKLAEIVGSGHKVVIFSQFVMLLDRVRAALAQSFPDLPRYELTGMTLDRLRPVQAFQTAPGAAVMLVSLKAAGTGITLQAADYVFLLDPWWNPAVEAQAVDRVHRIGQKSTVFVYRMVTAGTIEERIEALKASKKDLFDKLVGGLGGDFDLSQHFSSLRELTQLTSAATETTEQPAEFVAGS